MKSSMSIKWCKKNLERFSQPVYDLLSEEFSDVPMEISDCVDTCGLCTDVPFALRNGAVVTGRDALGLYAKLKRGMSFFSEDPLPGTYAAIVATSMSDSDTSE